MAKVQKPLPGLARFLGIETQGLLRLEALNSVQPVLEIEDYLGPNNFAQLDDPAVAQNGIISITVPEKQFWRLKWVSVTVDTPAAVYTNAIINLVPLQTGLSMQLNPMFIAFSAGGASTNAAFGNSQASGYGVPVNRVNAAAGDQIQAQLVNGTGAGNNRVRLFVQYQKLDI